MIFVKLKYPCFLNRYFSPKYLPSSCGETAFSLLKLNHFTLNLALELHEEMQSFKRIHFDQSPTRHYRERKSRRLRYFLLA